MDAGMRSEDLRAIAAGHEGSLARDVLRSEIDGLKTAFRSITPGETVEIRAAAAEGRVCLFTSGVGTVDDGAARYEIREVALYAPRHNTGFSLTPVGTHLEVLELVIDLSAQDLKELEASSPGLPLFRSYSQCPTYRERIKSAKTVSRTLLPEYTFPRLCIGSVQTAGDDHVGAHRHPMLEQLFFGLQDNACTVHADDAEMEFGEGVLLHIPLGSNHSVDVKEPNELHYIWIDLFRDRQGMDWIAQQHFSDE